LLVFLAIGGIGGILPDLEKLWNGFTRGSWHQEGYGIGFYILGFGIMLIIIGLVKSYRCRL
jgi:hypothetical protein